MSKKIKRLDLSKLWNSEYTIFVNQIIAIITKFQPALLHLEKAFNKLVAYVPELAKIKAHELSNALSKILSDLDSERDILYKAIVAQIKTLGKVNLASINLHVLVLSRFIETHGEDIPDAPYNAETKRIKDLEDDYNKKEDVKLAAETLNLKYLFDQLFSVNINFDEQFMQRSEETAGEEKVNTREIRAIVNKTLGEFYEAFEFCSREYEELDYEKPANELNTLIQYYKTQLKARDTRRKAGEDLSSELPIVVPE